MTSITQNNPNLEKVSLRKGLIARRRALHKPYLQQASNALFRQAADFKPLWQAKRVASYAAYAGEIDPRPLEEALRSTIFHPRIGNSRLGQMHFHPSSTSNRRRNSLGILEPILSQRAIDPRQLDIVLMPLVGFQRDGCRIGQGGGFYDRAFAFRNDSWRIKKPLLVGLAHHFQEVQGIEREAWDVAADVIITDKEIIIV